MLLSFLMTTMLSCDSFVTDVRHFRVLHCLRELSDREKDITDRQLNTPSRDHLTLRALHIITAIKISYLIRAPETNPLSSTFPPFAPINTAPSDVPRN